MKNSDFFNVAFICLFLVSAACGQKKSASPPEQYSVKIENLPKFKKANITVNGKLFTSFLYSDTLEKPFLFPVNTDNGIAVTRGFPIAPREGEQTDHPHHTGFWFGYGNVNGIDFWGNSKAIPASEKARYGVIRFRCIDKIRNDGDKAVLEVTNEWINPDGTIPLEEHVVFTFRAGKEYRIIDRVTTLSTKLPQVSLDDTKEGAFAIRVARFLDMPSNEPAIFVDAYGKPTLIPEMNNKGVTGNYVSSEGFEGAEVWGKRAKWMELYGIKDSDTVSIVFMDHPSNVNYPTFWHARGYGLFSANPFGQKDFTNGKENLNFILKKGRPVTFRHRLYIKSGKSFSKPEIGQQWINFSKN